MFDTVKPDKNRLVAPQSVSYLNPYHLFFHQISIWLLQRLRQQNFFFKQENMLTISHLIFRMKENATMYFLITIAASVAFVGIATTMVMGSGDFASTQEIS